MKYLLLSFLIVVLTIASSAQEVAFCPNDKETVFQYKSYDYRWGHLIVNTKQGGIIEILPISNDILKVSLSKGGDLLDTTRAVKFVPERIQMEVHDVKDRLHITSGYFSLIIHKKDMSVSYYYNDKFLTEHERLDSNKSLSLSFKKKEAELFWGLGVQDKLSSLNGGYYEFLPKYIGNTNKSIPVLLSSRNYLLFIDNPLIQSVDIAKKNNQKVVWTTASHEMSFYLIGGNNYRSLIKSYFQLVGSQDVPPLSLMTAVKEKELQKNQLIWDDIATKGWDIDSVKKEKIDTINDYLKYQTLNLRYRKLYPENRFFHLKDTPFIGASDCSVFIQRKQNDYSWTSLKTYVPALLHSSVSGIPYIYSVIKNNSDEELGLRKLELTAFSPLFVYEGDSFNSYSEESKLIIKSIISERRSLILYFYTLAWQQANLGELLMRPTFFYDPQQMDSLKFNASFLLGNNLLVFPITEKNLRQKRLYLPKGKWYEYYSNQPYQGGKSVSIVIKRENIPVFVKAGTFLPKVSVSHPFKSDSLWLTYFPVDKDGSYNSRVYEDDGKTPKAWKHRKSEIMNFQATEEKKLLTMIFRKQVFEYKGRQKKRQMIVQVLRNARKIKKIFLRGKRIKEKEPGSAGDYYSVSDDFVTIYFEWRDQDVVVEIKY